MENPIALGWFQLQDGYEIYEVIQKNQAGSHRITNRVVQNIYKKRINVS
jgi:hypothetical protein